MWSREDKRNTDKEGYMIELIDTQSQEAVIIVIGVGGCGGNAVGKFKRSDFGIKFGVVLEDRFSTVSSGNTTPDIEKGKANVRYLRDNYFNNPQYIRLQAGQTKKSMGRLNSPSRQPGSGK